VAKFTFTYQADNGHSETHEADAGNQAEVVRMIYMVLARAVGNESYARSQKAQALLDQPQMTAPDAVIEKLIMEEMVKLAGYPTLTEAEARKSRRKLDSYQAEMHRRSRHRARQEERQRLVAEELEREAQERQHECFS
jgi:hypothetical protein